MPSIYGMGGICAVFTLTLFPCLPLCARGQGSIDRSVEECAENLGLGRSPTANIRSFFVFSTVAIVFILILGILMAYVIVRRRGRTGGVLLIAMFKAGKGNVSFV